MNQNEIVDFLKEVIEEKKCRGCTFDCSQDTKCVRAKKWLDEMYE